MRLLEAGGEMQDPQDLATFSTFQYAFEFVPTQEMLDLIDPSLVDDTGAQRAMTIGVQGIAEKLDDINKARKPANRLDFIKRKGWNAWTEKLMGWDWKADPTAIGMLEKLIGSTKTALFRASESSEFTQAQTEGMKLAARAHEAGERMALNYYKTQLEEVYGRR